MYLKGNLQVEKATVLTFDDGFMMKNTIEVLEKYNLFGTVFVITSAFNDYSHFQSDNLLVQSHTDNFHRNYVCAGGSQGGAILCASEKSISDDLKKSIDKIGTKPIALAFPFYDYNEKAIKVLKQIGFKMAFIGRAGVMGKATPNKTDLYKIPRMTVWEQNLMSFNTWKSYL
jgi:peptidoglycan/xylan/chitin deacetylase (PgdA/CDA1 family)